MGTLIISMIPKALTTANFRGGKASSDAATASSVWILAPPLTACSLLFSLGFDSLVFILLAWLLLVVGSASASAIVVVVVDKKPGRNHTTLRCRIASCRGHLMYLFLNFVWSRKQKNALRRSRKLTGFCGSKCLEIEKPTASSVVYAVCFYIPILAPILFTSSLAQFQSSPHVSFRS